MSVPHFRAILPAVALALLTAGVVPANTINIDNSPAPVASAIASGPAQRLIVAVAQENSSNNSFSVAIDGDYTAFGDGSPFFAAGVFDERGPIMLSFEVTSGYAPDTGILHAIRSLFGR